MDIKMVILNIALNTSEKSQYMQMGMHGLCRLLQHYTHLNICEFPTIRHSVNRKTCIVNIHSTENYTCGASNHI